MLTTRIREVKLSYDRTIEEYLQRFCSAERLNKDNCPKHLKTPAFLISYHRQPVYSPPNMEVCENAIKQEFSPIFTNGSCENSFNGIFSYVANQDVKPLCWYPPKHSAESMSEEELDQLVETSITELEAVLQ